MSDFIVSAWIEDISIPTYKTGEPDKNPMFLEKRVYQGSSGAVYPYPVIDKVCDEKSEQTYRAVFMENRYLKIMILPELGGRIQMAYDKTNDYHFIYYNEVIKPALVGLTGPWISGGIEFNWPQHHRPGTFDPVNCTIEENEDGSITAWVGEIEKKSHTKGMAGITLYPDKAYIEIKGRIYNRTPLPQTFLWWANPAVSVDDTYQSVFPPDVNAVYDHGKRDVSDFPIATGTYYKVDYGPGTDISKYKNIPVPTSYMAVNSSFDFVGGYNHGKNAGILHVANHNISPGKKQWTWGNGAFGKAWNKQLTDENGPYIELMTGMFTDNQPDFSWIMPNEERNFLQYFMPYKNIGNVKNASIDAMVNLELIEQSATIQLYVTSKLKDLVIRLYLDNKILFEDTIDLSPEESYSTSVTIPANYKEEKLKLIVLTEETGELVSYSPVSKKNDAIPEPAKPIVEPGDILTTEGLFLAGQHLEQYRHATYSPVVYYEEALARDPSDIRNNNALGLWYLRNGQFSKAEQHFCIAIGTQATYNSNPYDGEVIYNLGLALFYQQRLEEAYSFFYKACWNAAWQDKSFLYLARIDARNNNYSSALDLVSQSVIKNYHGFVARHLKTIILRKLQRFQEAELFIKETLAIDPLDFAAIYEQFLVQAETGQVKEAGSTLQQMTSLMRDDSFTYIEIALDYIHSGFYMDAIDLLERVEDKSADPFTCYYIAYAYALAGNIELAVEFAEKGFKIDTGHVFLNRLEDISMLKTILQLNAADHKAWYYLGNLWYDKRQYTEAIHAWEASRNIFDKLPTVHRNLGLAYYNRMSLPSNALECYARAFILNPSDSRILFEFDQLKKRLNHSVDARLYFLNTYIDLIRERDDIYLEYISLLNLTGNHTMASMWLANRKFHPWEGGEGKVSAQYILTKIELAKTALLKERYEEVIELLYEAEEYPDNLGEGKLFGARENELHYWKGCAFDLAGYPDQAKHFWEKASDGITEPSPAVFYNDQQPDHIFYQGLALLKLERTEEAVECFSNLLQYGELHLNDEVKIDFFAVSLPDLLIFDDDLNKRNRIHCSYLMGLGCLGMGHTEKAKEHFNSVLEMDKAHQGAIIHAKLLKTFRIHSYLSNHNSTRFPS